MAGTKCPQCRRRVPEGAKSCPRCGGEIGVPPAKGPPKWHERTDVSLGVGAVLAVAGLGFIHVIVGVRGPRELPFDLALRERFGYRELLIDAEKIYALPYVAAKSKYPLGFEMLQMKGYLPSDPTWDTRMIQEMRETMARWYAEFEARLARPQVPWPDRLKEAPQPAAPDPQAAAAYNSRGIAAARQGRYDAALAAFATAIRKDPTLAEACYNRALVYVALGNLGQATTDFDQFLTIRPQAIDARVQRGRLCVTLERYDEASADFTSAIETDPTCADAYLWRAMVRYAQGDNDEALQDIRTLQDLGASVPPEFLAALQTNRDRPLPRH